MKFLRYPLALLVAMMAIASTAAPRTVHLKRPAPPVASTDGPAYCNVAHNIGEMSLGVGNDGTFGTNFSLIGPDVDCFTGEPLADCEFPRYSHTRYLFGAALWIGAVVGNDTLVSTGTEGWSVLGKEFHPDSAPDGLIAYRSRLDPTSPAYQDAVSDQDFVAVYRDSCTGCAGVAADVIDGRPHVPLNIEITQRSYAWGYAVAEDIVFLDYSIRNTGSQALEDVYVGFLMDCDVHDRSDFYYMGAVDDISGYHVDSYIAEGCPSGLDLQYAWSADNDGDLSQSFLARVPHAVGLQFLRTPMGAGTVSFNWFISNGDAAIDFGPMMRSKFRDFGTGATGTPVGDRNKYYLLSNGDQDPDQPLVNTIGSSDPIWLPPPESLVDVWSAGVDTRYVLSAGPFSIESGEEAPLTMAFMAGENLHTSADNYDNLPADPHTYLANLDFADLTTNAARAHWIYDNPGIDTDGDGYAGEYVSCDDGDVYYRGDGIPDWRAASEPSAPTVWLEPEIGAVRVRWNGHASETEIDFMSRLQKFEGYRCYMSTSGARGTYSLLGSYDVEDYVASVWSSELGRWIGTGERLTLENAVCRFAAGGCGDNSWHPMDYAPQQPYIMPGYSDSVFYFEPILVNACEFGHETPFVKRFPAASRPGYASPEDVPQDSVDYYLTEDGYFKYYEYEFLIENLLPGESRMSRRTRLTTI
jgi:hypothetical protein